MKHFKQEVAMLHSCCDHMYACWWRGLMIRKYFLHLNICNCHRGSCFLFSSNLYVYIFHFTNEYMTQKNTGKCECESKRRNSNTRNSYTKKNKYIIFLDGWMNGWMRGKKNLGLSNPSRNPNLLNVHCCSICRKKERKLFSVCGLVSGLISAHFPRIICHTIW